MDVVPLALWDGLVGDGRGGTHSFVEYWETRGSQVEVVRLSELLAQNLCKVSTTPPPPAPVVTAPPPPAPVMSQARVTSTQEIKAMLFADIVGFTKLTEVQIPDFVDQFLVRVAKLFEELKRPPIYKNTWGDAVYCVFDHVTDAGVFALKLRDLVRGTNWVEFGLPKELNIRIALHAGPVYPCYDPVINKLTFLGQHVNRTARIEPVAEEGQIYASQAFAALATAEGSNEFVCDYVGLVQLAKKYGAIPVFLVR